MCPVHGNRLAHYYMVPKHTGELWMHIGTPLSPFGDTGVMVCVSRTTSYTKRTTVTYQKVKK